MKSKPIDEPWTTEELVALSDKLMERGEQVASIALLDAVRQIRALSSYEATEAIVRVTLEIGKRHWLSHGTPIRPEDAALVAADVIGTPSASKSVVPDGVPLTSQDKP